MSRLAKPPPWRYGIPSSGTPRTPEGPGQHPPGKRWDTRPPGLGRSLPAVGGLSVWLCRPQGQLVTSCEGPPPSAETGLGKGWQGEVGWAALSSGLLPDASHPARPHFLIHERLG